MRRALKLLWKDIKDIKWAIIIIIAYFALGRYFLYSLCPMVMVTGLPCPGCGLTRAGFALLRLDLAGAYRIHPFIYPIAGYIAVFGWNRYIMGRRMGKKLKAGLTVLMVLVILFYGWRMWMYFPGEPPMSYYERNLLRFLSGRMLR
ncbi:MAG: DUF2752 domain-containing protein [Dorea sp.]|uniref:DUF2752 domain-containing protein n=1 Tax=Sporofaciens sp. JLR.KK001 TaxID=3112621 RepID=UPI002172394F|nr:DUF2752 domain-containing protein [Dorea sp.]